MYVYLDPALILYSTTIKQQLLVFFIGWLACSIGATRSKQKRYHKIKLDLHAVHQLSYSSHKDACVVDTLADNVTDNVTDNDFISVQVGDITKSVQLKWRISGEQPCSLV